MIRVALTVLVAVSVGIACERRTVRAPAIAQGGFNLMLYVLIPFVAYAGFSHLRLSVGAGLGLILAEIGLCLAGALVWLIGRRRGYSPPVIGALICVVIMTNTGFLGLPMTLVLLGPHALSHAVAYDQVISAPTMFTLGFAVGAMFGVRGDGRVDFAGRVRAFLLRNPPLWAAIAGLLVPMRFAPHVLLPISHVVVYCELVIGFFAVGVFLSSERRHDHVPLLEWPDQRVVLALGARFLVAPSLMLAWMLIGIGIPSAYVLEAAMPAGVTCLLIGNVFGLDQRLIASVIVWGTALALLVGLVVYLG